MAIEKSLPPELKIYEEIAPPHQGEVVLQQTEVLINNIVLETLQAFTAQRRNPAQDRPVTQPNYHSPLDQ